MKNKKNKKHKFLGILGFTLIELLVTILIVALVGTVGFISIKAIIDNSKEKSNTLNVTNIVKSAHSYTEEFKTMDKYWFIDSSNTSEEYSCTTVGMLINKGFLKDSILDTVIDGENVTRDTSVKIKRNKNTKVNNGEDIVFNSPDCDELADIKMEFDVSGETGNPGWYIKDVNVRINVTNASQIDKEYTSYVIKDDSGNVKDANITSEENKNGDNWQVKVGDEGKKLNLCISIKNYRDKYQVYCLSDSNKEYNMDKTKPSTPSLTLDLSKNNYNIISNGSSDNVTSNSNLKYFINYDENLEEKEHSLGLGTRVTNKNVSTYVEDEAGNKSDTYVSTLNIIDSKNDTPTSRIEYYCSLNSNKYNNYNDAYSECNKTITGTVTNNTYYKCSFYDTKYNDYESANNNCTKIITGTITRESNTHTDTTTVGGSCTYSLVCTGTNNSNRKWCSTGQTCTNNGCPSGYSKDSYTCGWYGGGGSCSTQGATSSHTAGCTNYCSRTVTTYSYYCSVTNSYVSGYYSDCSSTQRGIVSTIENYYCSLTNNYYSSIDDANSNCVKKEVGSVSNGTIYTCPLNNKDYDTNDKAVSACTNYCSIGKYYSNSCYDFK